MVHWKYTYLAIFSLFVAGTSDAAFNLADLNIDSVIQSVGVTGQSNPTVTQVNVTPVIGASATYDMSGQDSFGAQLDLYLTVELISFTGVAKHRIELGQSNTGLMGIEIISGNTTGQSISATYRFSFFEQDGVNLGSAFSLDTIMQTRDIDLRERVTVAT